MLENSLSRHKCASTAVDTQRAFNLMVFIKWANIANDRNRMKLNEPCKWFVRVGKNFLCTPFVK